jgi:hypothetical protein
MALAALDITRTASDALLIRGLRVLIQKPVLALKNDQRAVSASIAPHFTLPPGPAPRH